MVLLYLAIALLVLWGLRFRKPDDTCAALIGISEQPKVPETQQFPGLFC